MYFCFVPSYTIVPSVLDVGLDPSLRTITVRAKSVFLGFSHVSVICLSAGCTSVSLT